MTHERYPHDAVSDPVVSGSFFCLKAVRGFHIGGQPNEVRGQETCTLTTVAGLSSRVSDPNGRHVAGQMYAQHFQQGAPCAPWPIYFWHGGGMTGCAWEDTPDGRPGWHDYFLRQGYDTVLSDAVERGRASWPMDAWTTPPERRSLEQAWTLFRIGERSPNGRLLPYSHQQFPVEHMEQLVRQFVPRWTTHGELAVHAYVQLLQHTGAGVIIAHSEGARLAQAVACIAPEQIRALVLVEPAGGTSMTPEQAHALRHVPVCIMWGDHFAHSPLWQSYRAHCETWLNALRAGGGAIDVFDLPTLGIMGNSHLPMMDYNNMQLAQRIHDWIKKFSQQERDHDTTKFYA